MTARENALRILRFDKPERVMTALPKHVLSYQGMNHENYDSGGHDCALGTVWHDIWGTRWHKEHEGVMGFPRGNPLADPVALKDYRWPDPNDERLLRKMHDLKAKFPGGDLFLSGAHRDTLWEKAYMLVGMENMMMYFYTEPEFAREVLHRIMDFQLGIARHYLELGVETVSFGDDLGTQTGPLLGPAIVNEFLVPEYKRLFSLYKSHDILIEFHSCGCILQALDTFMDLGVDILNPVQATANDLDAVRAKTMSRMSLLGGVSTALVMDGPVDKIRDEVKKRIIQLGRNGGYFCAPDQVMPFPKPHLEAFNAAVEEFGKYPV
jgi:uroporphyrinogen decarboxylase